MDNKKEYKGYEYETFDSGYSISKNGSLMFEQFEPYANIFVADGSYEDNAKAQIDSITAPPGPALPTSPEQLRADIDYIALMNDIDLPSNESEGE